MKKQKKSKGIISTCILLILVLVIGYSGLQILESTDWLDDELSAIGINRKTITRDGVDYFPRQDITVMMVLGIDLSGPVESSRYYRNDGEADTVMLLIFDETNKECSILNLNRDTMLDMDVLGVKGEYAGTNYGQLALAHTYGTGLEDSCKNTKNTLENFIHGLTIDYYVAMNMDALTILNDAVGGVEVTVVDDFSKVNPDITMGEFTLRGDQVLDYVRGRKNVGDQLNTSRMERQKEYAVNFLEALQTKAQEDGSFYLSTYDEVAPYIVTDCSAKSLSAMLERYEDFTIGQVVTPEGKNVRGEKNYEFYADEEKLDQLIVSLFYAPKRK